MSRSYTLPTVQAALASSWLSQLCAMIPGVRRAVFAPPSGADGPLLASAVWPGEQEQDDSTLLSCADMARRRGASVVVNHVGASGELMDLAQPLEIHGQSIGVVAVTVEAPARQQQALLSLLQWGAAWLVLLLEQGTENSHGADASGIDAWLGTALAAPELPAVAISLCVALVREPGLERVSIGWRRGGDLKLLASSRGASFDPRMERVGQWEAAMLECLLAGEPLEQAEADPGPSLSAHSALLGGGIGHVLSLPLVLNDEVAGVLLLEYARAPSPDGRRRLAAMAPLLARVLGLKQAAERSWHGRLRDALTGIRPVRGMGLGVGLLALLIILFGQGEFRVSGPASLEGVVQQAVVSPYDGYIAEAHVRAGDRVRKGDALARLDARELRLEARRLEGELSQLDKEYRQALAAMEQARSRIGQARMAQTQAQLDLVQRRMQRAALSAPFDGVIISGDLSRALGSPVTRGQVLFEVAPLDEYRVVMNISDWDIGEVRVGQAGQLTLAAMPGERLPLRVSYIARVAPGDDQSRGFRVEALYEGDSPQLRPGMQGVGKIVVGERPRWWIWSRRLSAWLRLQLWSWWP